MFRIREGALEIRSGPGESMTLALSPKTVKADLVDGRPFGKAEHSVRIIGQRPDGKRVALLLSAPNRHTAQEWSDRISTECYASQERSSRLTENSEYSTSSSSSPPPFGEEATDL